jgi:hypothetical protein
MKETVRFFSDGNELIGDLFFPDHSAPQLPAVVLCHGWGAARHFRLNDIAGEFAARGFAALSFDYRGHGESAGARDRLRPLEHVADAQAAVTYVCQRKEIDPARVGIIGTSYGAGIAVQCAADDQRVRAVIAKIGYADGERWMRVLRRHWEWMQFRKRLEADRVARVLTGVSELVDPNEIVMRDPEAAEHEKQYRENDPSRAAWRLRLETADALIGFKPVEVVDRIAPRAALFLGIEDDGLTPIEETLDYYEHARAPKELIVLRGMQHHDMYSPQRWPKVMDSFATFYQTYMPADATAGEFTSRSHPAT